MSVIPPAPDEHGRTVLLNRLRRIARTHPWDGHTPLPTRHMVVVHSPCDPDTATSIAVSFDVGPHASGWWRNSDYDACWHLSLASHDITRLGSRPSGPEAISREEARLWAKAAFGRHTDKLWWEPPASILDPHRLPGVTHLRLFVDRQHHPIVPEGEVYMLKPWPDGTSPEKVFR